MFRSLVDPFRIPGRYRQFVGEETPRLTGAPTRAVVEGGGGVARDRHFAFARDNPG